MFRKKTSYKNIMQDVYSNDKLVRYAQFLFGIFFQVNIFLSTYLQQN